MTRDKIINLCYNEFLEDNNAFFAIQDLLTGTDDNTADRILSLVSDLEAKSFSAGFHSAIDTRSKL